MMQGYDKDAAVAFITRCIRKADHPELAEDIPASIICGTSAGIDRKSVV